MVQVKGLTRGEILSLRRTSKVVDEVLPSGRKGQVLDAADEALSLRHLFPAKKDKPRLQERHDVAYKSAIPVSVWLGLSGLAGLG